MVANGLSRPDVYTIPISPLRIHRGMKESDDRWNDPLFDHLDKCAKCKHPTGWDEKFNAWWRCLCEVEEEGSYWPGDEK